MLQSKCVFLTTFTFVLATGTATASAREPPPWFEPAPPDAPLRPTVAPNPDGSVTVTRTPEQIVDVHAPTTAGTVHAYGCNRIDPDSSGEGQVGARCTPKGEPLLGTSRIAFQQVAYYDLEPISLAPRRDPVRTGTLVASSVVFSVGSVVAGTIFLVGWAKDEGCDNRGTSACNDFALPALYSMGAIMTFTPSIPRFVMGDYVKGLLFTALRGGSFATGAFVDWEDSQFVPFAFGFVVPMTLGIVDLATTPRREDMRRRDRQAMPGMFQLLGVGPTVAKDVRGKSVPAFGAMGTF
jgi:hypothetical protein